MRSGYVHAAFRATQERSGKGSHLLRWSAHSAAVRVTEKFGLHRHLSPLRISAQRGMKCDDQGNPTTCNSWILADTRTLLLWKGCCGGLDGSACWAAGGESRANLHNLGQTSQRADWSLGRLAGFKHHYQRIHFSALQAVCARVRVLLTPDFKRPWRYTRWTESVHELEITLNSQVAMGKGCAGLEQGTHMLQIFISLKK